MSSRPPRRYALLCLAAMPFACSSAFAAETNVNLNLDLNLKAVPNVELRLLQEPPKLKARARPANRAASRRDEFEKSYDMYIRYANGTIYNPTTAKHDKVRLRSYQQTNGLALDGRDEHAATFMAPTVVMAPGQTVRFKLYNQLAGAVGRAVRDDRYQCGTPARLLQRHQSAFARPVGVAFGQ